MPQRFEPESSGENVVPKQARQFGAGEPVKLNTRKRPDEGRFEQKRHTRRARRALIQLCSVWICVGFGTVAASVYAAPVGYKILYPYQLSAQLRREADALERQLLQQREKNSRLRRDIERLETPAGIEEEARKITWRRPDEIVYYVPATDRESRESERSSEIAPRKP
jgi:cell division protein FtsB